MPDKDASSNQSAAKNPHYQYNHQAREPVRKFLRFLIRLIGFNLLAKLERVEGTDHVPAQGPAVLMINHIAFIDPIAVLHVLPRNIVPLAKVEAYDLPLIGIFPRLWGVIPVRREEFDRRAVQQALAVLAAGEIILVAPEATRSPQLQQGKEGVAYIASRADAPIIPVGIEGTPGFPALRTAPRWKEEGVSIRFGRPFRFRLDSQRPNRDQLRQMTDEAMYQLAHLLPDHRRGIYADLSKATQQTIEFL
jgi:1-acyl-sn-glycerol-3-phosphate acyltransferase